MDFSVALFLESIPGAIETQIRVGGLEQRGIFIPLDPDVFFLAKSSKRFLQINLVERDKIIGTETHGVYFSYPNPEKKPEGGSRRGYGRCYLSKPYDMNKDTTNPTTFVGFGTICLDDIPEDAIYTNPGTGKRFVRIMAKPLAKLDRGDNNLILAINPDFGANHGTRQSLNNGMDAPLIDIGRMKEFKDGSTKGVEVEDKEDIPTQSNSNNDADRMLGEYKF